MEPFKSILVEIDATVPAHPALERAIHLARSARARLTITDVMTVPAYAHRYLPADLEEEMVSRRRQQLVIRLACALLAASRHYAHDPARRYARRRIGRR